MLTGTEVLLGQGSVLKLFTCITKNSRMAVCLKNWIGTNEITRFQAYAVGREGNRYRSCERSWDFISCKIHGRPWQEFPAQSFLCHSGQEEANEAQAHSSHSVAAQLKTISDTFGISYPFIPKTKWLLHSFWWNKHKALTRVAALSPVFHIGLQHLLGPTASSLITGCNQDSNVN